MKNVTDRNNWRRYRSNSGRTVKCGMKNIPRDCYLGEFLDIKTAKGKKSKMLKAYLKRQNRKNRHNKQYLDNINDDDK